jgi:hypothetical protein
MRKKIFFSMAIILIVGVILYYYPKKVYTIFDVHKVKKIDLQFTKREVISSDVICIAESKKSFSDTKTISQLIEIFNSSKLVDKIDTTDINYSTYDFVLHNKGGNTTYVELRLSSENFAELIILARSATEMPKTYIMPSEQIDKLYDILKDS